MRFKRLEMTGFKSFADRTFIDFQDGITAIVGPNGCGKSNISDAIRWVLGEQSAHYLRGDNAIDFIFKGSGGRKPTGMAEVTLTIDNADRTVRGPFADFAEIQVTRRIHRDGEREYFINKIPCRLKDIRDLFMDTGMSGRGVAILQQGHIDAILNAKPEERRALFDEAAGITSYKIKKEAASRKLVATEENLSRVQDIIQEVEKQLRRLERQARDAERYRQLRHTLRLYEAHIACARLEAIAGRSGELETAAAGERRALEDLETAIARTEAQVEARRLHAQEQREQSDRLRERCAGFQQEAARIEGELRTQETRLHGIDRERQGLAADLGRWTDRLRALADQRARLDVELDETSRQRQELEASLDGLQATLRDLVAEREEQRRALAEARRRVAELGQMRSRNQTRLEYVERQRHDLEERQQRLAVNEASLAVEADQLTARTQETDQAVRAAQERVAANGAALQTARERLRAAQETEQRTAEERDQVRANLQRLEARHEALRDLLREAGASHEQTAALPGEVQQWWQEARTVAHGLRVPADLEPLVERLLGEELWARLLGDDGRADALTEWAASHPLPATLALLAGAAANGHGPAMVPDGRERLVDHIDCEAELRPWLEARLGRVILVERIDCARDAWRHMPGWSVAARDGQLLEAHGLLRLGQEPAELAGTLSRHREQRELVATLPEVRRRLDDHHQRLHAVRTEVATGEATVAAAQEADQQAHLALQGAQHRRAETDGERARLESRLAVNRDEATALAVNRANLDADVERLHEERARLAMEEAERGQEITRHEGRLAELEGHLEGQQHQVVEAKVRFGHLDGHLRQIDHQRRETADEEERGGRERAAKSGRVTDLDREDAAIHGQLGELRAQLAGTIQEGEHAQRELQVALSTFQEADAQVQELNAEARRLRTVKEEAVAMLHRLEQELDALRHEGHEIHALFEEKHQRTPQVARQEGGEAERPLAEMEQEIPNLVAKLERIGPVNLMAIAEKAELDARLTFLQGQREDLQAAVADIREAIRRINKTSKERFVTTFAAIGAHFTQLFASLFEGGHAELHLVDPDDPLESGIDIIAQPPGKRLQNISLLSGGEKALTTLALIFATYQVKPAPFCLLDEVDAPLDDANVGRFNRLLRAIGTTTQFTTITHNKTTMEAADALYGITMAEPGISSLIAVHLEDERDVETLQAVAVG
ncbi:MAG TPA: chromosome segregation protein SMC [bacterium]